MRSIRTPEKRDAFLAALQATGNVTKSCGLAGLSRVAVYAWRNDDEDFRAAWEAANETGTDALEDEALRRAVEGGSDTLLIFMLKGRRPEKFKDRVANEHFGKDGGPLTVSYERVVHLPADTLAEIEDLIESEKQ